MYDDGDPTKYEIKFAEISNKKGFDGEEGEDSISLLTKKLPPNTTYGQIIKTYLKLYSKYASDSVYESGTFDSLICENFFRIATQSDYLTFMDTQPFYVFKK